LCERLQGFHSADPVLLGFEWGDLEFNEVRRAMDLFVEHVMPVMREA
jgi:hypothetical protein